MGTNMSETQSSKDQLVSSASASELNIEDATLSDPPLPMMAQATEDQNIFIKHNLSESSNSKLPYDPAANVNKSVKFDDFKSEIKIKYHITDSLDNVSIDDNKIESDLVCDFEDNKTDVASADSEDSALGSLPCESAPTQEDEPQDRSDGSDSGLGSEITEESTRQPFIDIAPIIATDSVNFNIESTIKKPEECLIKYDDSKCKAKSSLKRKNTTTLIEEPKIKKKKSISFDDVTVFYFPRAQGFTCIPSQGGSTLGMAKRHTHMQKFTLAEHTSEQRRLHRQILQQLRCERHSIQGSSVSSSDYSDSEDEPSEMSESELDLDSYYFLQPVPTRQRRALLRAAGVRKIEAVEKDECRDIRTSREFCGCGCKGYCDPETCSCSQAGIKCQVDRLNFPCGCTKDGCGNTTGRIEFNPVRVRTHFIHTLMRLGLEKKSEENMSKTEIIDQSQWPDPSGRLSISNNAYNCGSSTANILHETNTAAFNNMHYDNSVSNTKTGSNLQCREDSLDLYAFRDDAYSEDNTGRLSTAASSQQHQHKLISYPEANHGTFQNNSNISRFGCDINFSYQTHHESNHYTNQHFSSSSFEDFTQSSLAFNHYNSMYMTDYGNDKSNTQQTEVSAATSEYHGTQMNTYEVYRQSDTSCYGHSGEVKEPNQYTNLNSATYPLSNKLESFSELIQGRYNYGVFDSTDSSVQPVAPTAEQVDSLEAAEASGTSTSAGCENGSSECQPQSNSNDSDENFGEIIKKTMVETVSA